MRSVHQYIYENDPFCGRDERGNTDLSDDASKYRVGDYVEVKVS